MIKCSIVEDDFILISVNMNYCDSDLNRLLDDIANIKEHRFPILDMLHMTFPSIYTLEIAITIYKSFELESKMTIINASRNYKKAIKLYTLDDMFILKADEYEAMRYYKNYAFRKLWNV